MSAATAIQSYRFSSAKQWGAGLLARGTMAGSGRISPISPFARTIVERIAVEGGACAPSFDRFETIYWLDADGRIMKQMTGDTKPSVTEMSPAIALGMRIASWRNSLWAANASRQALRLHDRCSLVFLHSVPVSGTILDLTTDRRDGVWVLVKCADSIGHVILHVQCSGGVRKAIPVPVGIADPTALAYLRGSDCVVLLSRKGKCVDFLETDGTSAREPLPTSHLAACFEATHLASDGDQRIVLAGRDDGRNVLFVLDVQGEKLDRIELPDPIEGIALSRSALLVATAKGIARYGAGPDPNGVESSCVFLTPMLQSPDNADQRGWLRAEVDAQLPVGTSLKFEHAAISDARLAEQIRQIAASEDAPPFVRQRRIASLLEGLWSAPTEFAGSVGDDASTSAVTCCAPLFATLNPYLWLRVTLAAAPGAENPEMHALRVLYPNHSLMQNIPAIYHAPAEAPDLMRMLVGVLESTTQSLDDRISTLGELLDADTAPTQWLDSIARWFGLPWDDALAPDVKRALVRSGHRLLSQRGTLEGLRLLLEILFPGMPPRFRIEDTTASDETARVGGRGCTGGRLPARLNGLPRVSAILSEQAVLGRARLGCTDLCADAFVGVTGRIRVFITANEIERAEIEPWLAAVIQSVIPASARLELRWRRPVTGHFAVLSEGLVLDLEPVARLGATSLLGYTRLPAGGPSTLSESGLEMGRRLM